MDQGCAIDHLKARVTPVCENITNHLFRAGAQYCLAKIEFLCVFHSFNCLVKLARRFSARSLILRFENCLLLNHVTFHDKMAMSYSKMSMFKVLKLHDYFAFSTKVTCSFLLRENV
jgi:hypothetical protein